jgi:hypothetical protein
MGDYVSVVGSCPEYLYSSGTGCMDDDPPGSESATMDCGYPASRKQPLHRPSKNMVFV